MALSEGDGQGPLVSGDYSSISSAARRFGKEGT